MVQWLGLCAFTARDKGLIPREFHLLRSTAKNKNKTPAKHKLKEISENINDKYGLYKNSL